MDSAPKKMEAGATERSSRRHGDRPRQRQEPAKEAAAAMEIGLESARRPQRWTNVNLRGVHGAARGPKMAPKRVRETEKGSQRAERNENRKIQKKTIKNKEN